MRVALVVMPWWRLEFMPLGVATLKAYLQANGVEADCHYLNVRMFRRIGNLARVLPNDLIASEWFFAYHLFGPGGTGELSEELSDFLRFKPSQRITDFDLTSKVGRQDLDRLLHREIPAFISDCLESIPWGRYDLIGFSSTFSSHTACLKLSRELKARFSAIPIAFGGANVEGPMGEATLKGCGWIDYVFDGESEESLLALVRAIRSGRPRTDIPGVSRRDELGCPVLRRPGGKRLLDLGSLPDPDHDDFFRQLHEAGEPVTEPHVTFEASRGCWWGEKQNCTFCGLNGQTMTFRAKAPEAVAQMLLRLHRRYKSRYLQSSDNILSLDHLRDLMPSLAEIREKNGGLDWGIFFETKSNLEEPQIAAMARAGVTHIQPGIENLSTPVLRLMRKGVRAIQNVQTIKLAQSNGIKSYWNYLFGFPGETAADYDRAIKTILAITHLDPPHGYGPIRVDRFSPYHFEWEKLGTGKPVPNEYYRLIYPEPRFELDEIAYHFDFGEPVRKDAHPGLEQTLDFWMKVWPKNFFAYARGADFVELHDSRPLSLRSGFQYRTAKLTGLEAAVFRGCHAIKGFEHLLADCRAIDPGCDAARLRELLDGMTERRWLLEEDGLYLNLAILENQLPAVQRMALETMSAMARNWAALRTQLRKTPANSGKTSAALSPRSRSKRAVTSRSSPRQAERSLSAMKASASPNRRAIRPEPS